MSSNRIRESLMEVMDDLAIHDESLASIANDMKTHAVAQSRWAAHCRGIRAQLAQAEYELDQFVAQAVTNYSRSTIKPSASAVSNYAKYEVQTLPAYQTLKQKQLQLKQLLAYSMDIFAIFTKRADMLIALSRLDQNVILSAHLDARMEARKQTMAYNRMEELLANHRWGDAL